LLLTDRLAPQRDDGKYKAVPVMEYYNRLAAVVGATDTPPLPLLYTTPDEEARVDRLLVRENVSGDARTVVLNPGASFGTSKLWMPERFAQVADALHEQLGVEIFVSVGPGEEPIAEEVRRHVRRPAHFIINDPAVRLGGLKALVRRSVLLLTNDTGPRHLAIAFRVPVVTIFGATAQEWTDTGYESEAKISVLVDCGPCQKPVCPQDLRCLTRIDAEQVTQECVRLIEAHRTADLQTRAAP
jgi:heptosyltransferase-2